MQFVEIYPTEGELSNAVGQFGSWHQIVAKVEMYPTEQELSDAVRQFGSWHQIAAKFVEMYPTEDELRNAITQFGSWYQIVAKGLTRQARPTDRVGAPTHRHLGEAGSL